MVKIMQIDDFWKELLVNLIWTNWVRSLFILHAINLTLDFVLAQENMVWVLIHQHNNDQHCIIHRSSEMMILRNTTPEFIVFFFFQFFSYHDKNKIKMHLTFKCVWISCLLLIIVYNTCYCCYCRIWLLRHQSMIVMNSTGSPVYLFLPCVLLMFYSLFSLFHIYCFTLTWAAPRRLRSSTCSTISIIYTQLAGNTTTSSQPRCTQPFIYNHYLNRRTE